MEPCLENVKSSRKSKEEKKLLRKQIKASHVLLKHEGISTVSHPTQGLVVANGGLGNGVSREQLLAVLKEAGEVETLVMPPHKPYALVTYRLQDSAQRAHALFNGTQLHCGDQSVVLYLSFVDSGVSQREVCVSLPPGLLVVEDYVTPEEEAVLLSAIDWSSHDEDDVTAQKALKHRRVKHYGYEFRYDNNNVDKDKPLPGGLPLPCVSVLERCVKDGHVSSMPDQLTVNQYQSGQGIPPHVDTHSAFEDSILSLSLGAKTVMEFRHPDGRQVAVVLPGRSLLVMRGESRYLWTHGITPRKYDVVPACDPQSPAAVTSDLSNHNNLTLSKRGIRTSLTFRKIRFTPCDCAFPSACDSQRPAPIPASPPSLPRCPSEAARLEEQYVHRVYDSIAAHFSGTRHSPWPRVCHFLAALPPGSLLADLGCGNGKYLGVNPDVMAIGCDRSSVLVQICLERGHLALVSDALSVPLRSEAYDACISIAVIHHFSTEERRLAAVKELTRLLKPGGRALIYVWALEQEHNKQRSKYLRDPQGPSGSATDAILDPSQDPGQHTAKDQDYKENPTGTEDTSDSIQVSPGKESSTKLSVHTNRTAFNSQDLLVPWHLKEGGAERRRKEGVKGEGGGGGGGPRNIAQPCSNADLQTSVSSSDPKLDPSPKSGPVFHRFYHVFQQGELEGLCGRVTGVRVERSYHDQGNWCVVLEKTAGAC